MKSKIKEASHLSVFIIGSLCVVGMIVLVLLALTRIIDAGLFFILMLLDAVIMTRISQYLENHFVNGEWL